MYEKLNVAFNNRQNLDAQLLSNLAHTPFELDGIKWASVEAFWKSLYHPDHERPTFREQYGICAWAIFLNRPYPAFIMYQGKKIQVGSKAHHTLMKKAIRAKIEQNTDVQEALERTRYRIYEHIPLKSDGTPYPESTTIPGAVFAHILSVLRDDWLARNSSEE